MGEISLAVWLRRLSECCPCVTDHRSVEISLEAWDLIQENAKKAADLIEELERRSQ